MPKHANRLPFLTCLLLFFVFVSTGLSQDKQTYQSLQHALFSAGQLSGDAGPQNIQWIDGGDRFSYMTQDYMSGQRQILVVDPSTGDEELIFDSGEVTFPDSQNSFEFQSFQWSADYNYLIFQTQFRPIYRYSGISNYYYYSLQDESLQLVAEDAFTVELSPDGKKVGYHRDGDLFVFDLENEIETRLTDTADDHFFNGRFGWVYEEEFGLVQAWEWSPDSKYISFWQTDERNVERFVSTDYDGPYPEYTDIPYPKVGAVNPSVRMGVINTETGHLQWMDLDVAEGLVPRIYWTARDETLAILWMNRQQSKIPGSSRATSQS